MLPKNKPSMRHGRELLRRRSGHRCVLVTGAAGAAGRALTEQLQARGMEVHCADSRLFSGYGVACHRMPDLLDPAYLPELARLIDRHHIDLVIPARGASLPLISVGRLLLDVDVVVPGPGPTGIAHDRLLTARSLWAHDVSVPAVGVPSDFADADAALGLMGGQLVLRSRWATDDRTATVIRSSGELDWSSINDELIVQSFVPGPAYCAVVYRPLHGKGRVTAVLEERIAQDGTRSAVRARGGELADVERVAQAAVRALGLTGPVEVAMRCRADGEPQVLDVKACFGPNSALVPELLDAVLRDHPAPSVAVAGGMAAGVRTPRGHAASRIGALR